MKKNKTASIEYLRIIACLFVLFTHVFYRYNETAVSPLQIEGILLYSCLFFARSAVPIFVLISGYTMLDKQYSWKQVCKKILHIVLILMVFSLLTNLHNLLIGRTNIFSLTSFLTSVYNGSFNGIYWYIYMYIGLLLTLPFLQKLVQVLQKKDFIIYFIISIIATSVLPLVKYYIPLLTPATDLNLSFFYIWVGLMMFGYYLKKYPISLNLKTCILLIMSTLLSICSLLFLTIIEYQKGTNYLFLDTPTTLGIIIIAISLFVVFINSNIKNNKIIEYIGSCTLSIYMLNEILLFYGGIIVAMIQGFFPWIITLIITNILLFGLGLFMLYPLKKIKYFKNIF